MNRSLLKVIPVDEKRNRYEVQIQGTDCPAPPLHEARKNGLSLLSTCVNTPGMLDCGLVPFEKLTMHHDGHRWVINISAIS